MASKYSIETVFRILDGVTGPMGKMSASTSKFAMGFERDVKKAEMKWRAMGQTMKTVGKVAIGTGLAAVGAGLVSSTKKYIEFEDSITKAGSKFKDMDVTSEDYAEKLELLQVAARKVGAVTKYSATDAAGALNAMAMAGLTSEQSMALLMGTTNLATAAGTDLTSAVDMATDALGAFGFSSIANGIMDTEEQTAFLSGSLDRISDVVAKTTNMANTDMNMWFESVKMGAATFTSMGGTLEEFSGMVGILANAGIKGGEAGTALRNIMLNLGAPTKTAADALDKLGVQVYDSEHKMLPIIDILEQFEKSLAGVDAETKNAALENIFGKRGVGSFLTLMDAGTEQINKFVSALENSQGTAEAIARAQEKSLKGQLAALSSAFEDKQLSFGKAIADNGGSAGLVALITMVQNWDPTPVINFMIAVMDKLPAIINFVTGLVSTLWNFRDVIGAIVIGFQVYKAATMAVAAAQLVTNMSMASCPINLIITGIALGVFLIVRLTDSLSTLIGSLNVVLGVVRTVVMGFNPLMLILQGLVQLITEIISNWENLKNAFTDGGFLNGLRVLGGTIVSAIIAPLQGIFEMLGKIPGIGKPFKFIADSMDQTRQFARNGFEKVQTATVEQPLVEPVTQGERVAYSREENVSKVDMNIHAPEGYTATVFGSAPGIENLRFTQSSAY